MGSKNRMMKSGLAAQSHKGQKTPERSGCVQAGRIGDSWHTSHISGRAENSRKLEDVTGTQGGDSTSQQ